MVLFDSLNKIDLSSVNFDHFLLLYEAINILPLDHPHNSHRLQAQTDITITTMFLLDHL